MKASLTRRLGVAATAAILVVGGSTAAYAVSSTNESALSVSSVSASGDDGHVAANTIDGDPSTRWSAEGDGAWITYDLGSAQTVGSVAIAWYQGDTRVETFDVQLSESGSSWTTVADGVRTSGSTTDAETVDFADGSGRYLRIVGHGNTYNDWNSISETALFGADGGGGDGGGDGDGGDCEVPADVLDLTNWYEGLPIGDDGEPKNVYQPELDSYSVDPWFTVTDDCDGVQFRAAVNGVTTSGSSYPRSELREMNGDEKVAWSSTSGTHTMVINEEVTQLPEERPNIVVGQIHGEDDDVSVFRVEGHNLYITKDDTSDYQLVTDDFQLNTPFEAKFVVSDGTITAYYNGEKVATIDWDFDGAYFKAGAYTQANCEKSDPCSDDNYGEVIIHSLTVTHEDD